MDKIKKQFKDFWAYYRLLKYGANASDRAAYRKFLPLMIAVIIGIMVLIGQVSSTGDTFRFSMFLPFLCGISIATGKVTALRPSLIGVSPYTPKQRIVFSYLATLLRTIVATVMWTVLMIACMLLMALFVFVLTGENIFVVEDGVDRAISGYGYAHVFLAWLVLAFSSYAISHLNGKKARNISLVCLFVGLEILVLVLVNACGFAKQNYDIGMGTNDGLRQAFFLGCDVATTIEYLAHPWVVIVVEAVLCATAFAASVYCSILRYKSSKI